MPAAVIVLYEDQHGRLKRFGLHELVKACVFDAIDGDRHRVEGMLADARPLKGVQNLLRACRDDIEDIAADGRSVVAVIDDDAIRHHLRLPDGASGAQVEQAIKNGSRAPDRLFIALLERNTESVIEAAAACDTALDRARVERAVRHKDLLERDAILVELSRERARPVRDCMLGRMPSLRALVALVTRLLGAPAPRGASHGAEPAPAKNPRKRGKQGRA